MADVPGAVQEATDNPWFEWSARAGFAISGVLHLLIAYIAVRLAIGIPSGNADQSGALATVAGQTGGAVLLWVAATGLVALGLWRAAEAFLGSHPGEGRKRSADEGTGERLEAAGLAVVYVAMATSAASFAVGAGKSSSSANRGTSAQLMQSTWGRVLLIAIGLVVVVVGAYHVHKGATKSFVADDLEGPPGPLITITGTSGYVAKGLVLIGAGLLVVVATVRADPSQATGIDAAVRTLGQAPFGRTLLVLAAIGIAAFGAYGFARSRHARM